MINKYGISILFAVLLLGSLQGRAQTKDSSNAEIKKQALEMREKLNRYMADKLLLDEQKNNPGAKILLDSISTTLYNQQAEIDALKQRFDDLEKKIRSGELTVEPSSAVSEKGSPKGVKGKSQKTAVIAGGTDNTIQFEQVDEKKLVIYFPFDSYRLTKEQKLAFKAFLKGKKINRVKLTGYTDWYGTEEHNSDLAKNRCLALVKILNLMVIHYQFDTRDVCATEVERNAEKAVKCRKVEVMIK